MKTKVELDHKDIEKMISDYVKTNLGLNVVNFKIKIHSGQAELSSETYSVETECN